MKAEIIRSDRKTISIEIKGDGEVVVRAPRRMSHDDVMKFVASKSDWIEKHIETAKKRAYVGEKLSPAKLKELAEKVRPVIAERAAYYADVIGVDYGMIAIRSQHTRWGSCSSKGNLSFNCMLALVPSDVLDYVVIHELCHRKYMDHSASFWREVGKYCPEYKKHVAWLKQNGSAIIGMIE